VVVPHHVETTNHDRQPMVSFPKLALICFTKNLSRFHPSNFLGRKKAQLCDHRRFHTKRSPKQFVGLHRQNVGLIILYESLVILGTIVGLDALDRSSFLIFYESNDFKYSLDDFCFRFQESDFIPARLIIYKFDKIFSLIIRFGAK
jgi:hypothetical protein